MSQSLNDAQIALDGNRFLSGMPTEDCEVIRGQFRLIEVTADQVLESGPIAGFVYFPVDCTISLQYVLKDGHCGEVAVIGNEGIFGALRLFDTSKSPHCAIVRIAGRTWRCPRAAIRECYRTSSWFRIQLVNFCHSLAVQITQIAACNRHHTLRQQLCRWLLVSMDRSARGEFAVTHSSIAQMLGVRREGVTNAAIDLERSGLIKHQRGHIRILDRPGLEAACCECYEAMRLERDLDMA